MGRRTEPGGRRAGGKRRTPFTRLAIALAGLVLCAPGSSAAETFRVVVHPSNAVTSLPRDRVSAMFLKKVGEWPQGGPVLPVDLSAAGGLRDAFGKDVHGKDIAAILSYWKQMIVSGRGVPPPVKATDAEVVAYVRVNPGAIGYVSASAATDGVKVLRLD